MHHLFSVCDMSFKFLHSADVHIDSPLKGLSVYEDAPVERLRNATREAFKNLIQIAIKEQVAFVIIAGDLFDGPWRNMETGIWTYKQFQQLQSCGIPVFLLQGNHDAESEVERKLEWPDNVFQFSTATPNTFPLNENDNCYFERLRELNVALHGQGFARRDVQQDLAASYPMAVKGAFNIGVLHTSLEGSSEHDTYAPTSLATLRARGYDYWALGHIHQRSDPPLCKEPIMAYSGNIQGRHVRETGAKGCLIVEVDRGRIQSQVFHPTDTLRWNVLSIAVEEDDGPDQLIERATQQLQESVDQADGRLVAARLVFRGPCAAHAALARLGERSAFKDQLRARAIEFHDMVWLEKIELETSPPVARALDEAGGILLEQLLRHADRVADDEIQCQVLAGELEKSLAYAAGELRDAGIDFSDSQQMQHWLRQAQHVLLEELGDRET